MGLRNLIIIMMLGLLGLRTGSIVSMNIQDVDIVSGLPYILGRHPKNLKSIINIRNLFIDRRPVLRITIY
jgi:hypothetical protein